MISKYLTLFALLGLAFACNKTPHLPNPEPIKSKHVELTFNHVWGDDGQLILNQDFTHPETNETFNFTACNYYVSNFQLRDVDGNWWNHPFSYFLVKLSNESQFVVDLVDVKFDHYDAVRFLIGVDSLRNVSGAQQGDLAPSNAMFWSWSTGYIMMKFEGSSPQANWGFFSFHVGGFENSNNSNVTRWKEIEFDDILEVTGQNEPKIQFNVDVSKAWSNENKLTDQSSVHSSNALAHLIADQFSSAFSVFSVD